MVSAAAAFGRAEPYRTGSVPVMRFLLDPDDAAAEIRCVECDCQRGCAADRSGGPIVTGGRVPVLWVTGPAGVGKSTVFWQLLTELASSGTHVAFADAD